MDDYGGCPDGESSEASHLADLPRVIGIAETGDIVLDCVFENSKTTLKTARKITPQYAGQAAPKALKLRTRVGFRVSINVLKEHSKYFNRLLGDLRFKEAKAIEAAFAALSFRNVNPASAHAGDLPWVRIVDDDEATRLAHREEAFGDMLRVLHGKEAATEAPTLDFITTLAVLADRFDCAAPVSKIMASGFKFKWPITQRKGVAGEDPKMSRNIENTLREKVLVSWLLNQPTRFQASTKELIMNGSKNWSAFPEQDEGKEEATWWHLQDGIEGFALCEFTAS
ncbi:hypothetical protein TruAng_008465 [Truncatella angustata]|nr:hypothetical protein TruAng_008465 [Truncatella angustata]